VRRVHMVDVAMNEVRSAPSIMRAACTGVLLSLMLAVGGHCVQMLELCLHHLSDCDGPA
jgi:hypothetical protein